MKRIEGNRDNRNNTTKVYRICKLYPIYPQLKMTLNNWCVYSVTENENQYLLCNKNDM